MPPKLPAQLTLRFDDPRLRCQLCGRLIERRCKWCAKGGLGDPPMPEMKAWVTWTRGLERTLRKALTKADIGPALIEQTCNALFRDRGTVPPEARPYAEPYTIRGPSPASYDRDRAWAVLGHRIRTELDYDRNDPYSIRFADVLVVLSLAVIRQARERGITNEELDASDLVNAAHRALRETTGIVDPDGITPWHRVHRLAIVVVSTLIAARSAPKQRVTTAIRIDTPRLRIEPWADLAAAEDEAVAVEEQAAAEGKVNMLGVNGG